MSVITVDEAMEHLNITSLDNASELQGFIDAAEGVIADRCGPLEVVTVTDRITLGQRGTLTLSTSPVLAVTSINGADGSTIDPALLSIDGNAGSLSYLDGSWFVGGILTVVYTAGRTTVPPVLLMAVKEELRHLWRSQRGGSTRPGATPDGQTPGYLVPYMVAEMIEPYRQYNVA